MTEIDDGILAAGFSQKGRPKSLKKMFQIRRGRDELIRYGETKQLTTRRAA